jgi:GntR family transcriptional regulator
LVASGQLEPGTGLPSIRELALQHAINPMTASKAYSMLEAEGIHPGSIFCHRNRPRGMPDTEETNAAASPSGTSRITRMISRVVTQPDLYENTWNQ